MVLFKRKITVIFNFVIMQYYPKYFNIHYLFLRFDHEIFSNFQITATSTDTSSFLGLYQGSIVNVYNQNSFILQEQG